MKSLFGIFKKVGIVLVLIVLAGAIFGGSGESSSKKEDGGSTEAVEQAKDEEAPADTPSEEPEPVVEYQDVTVDDLTALLEDNPLKAKKAYQDAPVRLTGVLNNVDSSGDYFSLNNGDEWSFSSIHCDIEDEATLDRIASASIGDTLVVCGTITDVGEVLGYYMDVDYVE